MNKTEYLRSVNPFVIFLKGKIDSVQDSFTHSYQIREGNKNISWIKYNCGTHWSCNSLQDAHRKYYWASKNYYENEKNLNFLKAKLQDIFSEYKYEVSSKDRSLLQLEFMKCCRDILVWGGVLPHNSEWMVNKLCDGDLIKSFSDAKEILESEDPIIRTKEWTNNHSPYRMNAGYTKIFSLLCENFIIYDSRVAAALGLIIQDFLRNPENKKLDQSIKDDLTIRFMDAKGKQNRNPSNNNIEFEKMLNNAQHAEWNIKINWILSTSIEKAEFNWEYIKNEKVITVGNENKMRALESALFMIGYDLPNQ